MRFRLFTRRSLRGKIFRVVLGGVVVPFLVVGLWLTGTVGRSGEGLLRDRLDLALGQVALRAGERWTALRSTLLDVADDSVVQATLLRTPAPTSDTLSRLTLGSGEPFPGLTRALASAVILKDVAGRRRWVLDAPSLTPPRPPADQGISVSVPVVTRGAGVTIGSLETRLLVESIEPSGLGGADVFGAILEVIDRSTGAALGALPFDAALLNGDHFEVHGERWLVRRLELQQPAITLVAAAQVSAYIAPFEPTAKKGAFAILVVAIGGLAVATVLTRRMTNSLESLAVATQAVASGDLDRRVRVDTTDEVGRVGRAFNAMTESLRGTLRELSQRQSLAALGEFTAALSHEIRNPLTSIRIDLQRVQEKLPEDSALRTPLGRALREVDRLDHTVSGALRIARSGHIGSDLIDLRVPLQRAIEVAQSSFDERGGRLHEPSLGDAALPIRGDEAALEQVFLNILLNAAHAIAPGGEGTVDLQVATTSVQVTIRDNGAGIPAERLESVFDPFYTTKTDGTGLGLSVARQIVAAHGGSISIDSSVGRGTSVVIGLPVAK